MLHFHMLDSYGDGLFASQWGDYVDGVASIVSMDGMDDLSGIVTCLQRVQQDGASQS